jgi:serine phosphatase RsbU (regulator of sigma subunit)
MAQINPCINFNKQPIGNYAAKTLSSFTSHNLILEKGDSIYLFSDGIIDQFGGEDVKRWKSHNLKAALLDIQDTSMVEQGYAIEKKFNSWKGNADQIDDVCMIGFQI